MQKQTPNANCATCLIPQYEYLVGVLALPVATSLVMGYSQSNWPMVKGRIVKVGDDSVTYCYKVFGRLFEREQKVRPKLSSNDPLLSYLNDLLLCLCL